ncbi:MAG: site-2 protease family protein [Candidatus Paceibacterota bacterium]|jgi:regulator of sigma E protease
MTILLFLIILAVLVFVHELGHFISAKMFGIRVDEFAIGFPPKVFGWQRGETKYALNLIPFGGYVKIFGEDPNEESMKGADSARSFVNASKWKQIVVLLSGIFLNIVFAWILISISFNLGMLTSVSDSYASKIKDAGVIIISVAERSPAERAGLKEGDFIINISGDKQNLANPKIEQIQKIISESVAAVNLEIKRGVSTSSVNIVPIAGITEGKKAIGIAMDFAGTLKLGFFSSFWEGVKLTILEIKVVAVGMWKFIAGAFTGEKGLISQISGPVGIAGMVGQARNLGASYLLGFIALISINLAVLNAVPFPALDGGRVLFVFIEAVFRRKIKPAIANWANGIGFALLIGLMIFITYKDILKLIH